MDAVTVRLDELLRKYTERGGQRQYEASEGKQGRNLSGYAALGQQPAGGGTAGRAAGGDDRRRKAEMPDNRMRATIRILTGESLSPRPHFRSLWA